MNDKLDLLFYEKQYLEKGYKFIAGMDEAGRGPLAGPVTAACCIMDLSHIISGINDSKKIPGKKREVLFNSITDNAFSYRIADIDNNIIDEINILEATKKAMKIASGNLAIKPEIILIDAVKDNFGVPSLSMIHGDALSYSIAAASILAKVHRDDLMKKYAELYPEYGFEKHKGYGTKLHIEMLKKYGPCPIHRKTFIKNFFK